MAEYVAVLGLSTFAKRVAIGLEESGMRILAVDRDESRVQSIKDSVTRAVCGDLRDQQMLVDVGTLDCGIAVLGLPDHFDTEVLVVHFLSSQGMREIIVQVNSEGEGAAIEKVGATRVILPESVAAGQLVRSLSLPGLTDRIDLSEDAGIIEVKCPDSFVKRSLKDLDLRRRYQVHVIGFVEPQKKPGNKSVTTIAPSPETPLPDDTLLVVLGRNADLRNFALRMEKLRMKESESKA